MLGIPAVAYHYIYLLLILLLTLVACQNYSKKTGLPLTERSSPEIGSLLLMLFMTLFIGLRPDSYLFVDMMNYKFSYYVQEGSIFFFDPLAENYIFDNLFSFWASSSLGFNSFMLLICAINFGCTYVACKRFFPHDTMAAFLVFLGAFSTFSYATNGVKAGAAAAVFVLALSYYRQWPLFILLLLTSYGMHHSMQLPVAACILAHFYRNPKHYLYGWFLCVLISAAHITFFQTLFASMSADTMNDARGASYLNSSGDNWGGKSGFRLDFIMYSAMPVLVGYYAVIKKKISISDSYRYLLNVYLTINSVWMLCMYANFTNRIAYLSWLMYPIVLIYPYLREEWGEGQYRIFSRVMLYHLGFTLFMSFIYY